MRHARHRPDFARESFRQQPSPDHQRQQLARLTQALRREPQAIVGVLEYWLGSTSSQGASHVSH